MQTTSYESVAAEADRICAAVQQMHVDNMARNEARRAALPQLCKEGSRDYERMALELWAEGAQEYARRLSRQDREPRLLAAWYSLGALYRLTMGLPPHRPTMRHVAEMIRGLVEECAELEGQR